MIALDTNILVHAHRGESPWFRRASSAVAMLAADHTAWAIPWPCLHEFLAMVTHPRIFSPPTPMERACDQVDAWLESPTLVLLAEDDAYWPELRAVVLASHVAGPRVHEARIAALCQRNGSSDVIAST